MTPYFADDSVQLFLGDCREVMPTLGQFDCCVTDPPYGETSLTWDRWPESWPTIASAHTRSMWCFGSMRMFLDRRDEFQFWRLSQDVVWEKDDSNGFATDRFRRVHEHALHWYHGRWDDLYRETPREAYHGPDRGVTRRRASAVKTKGARGAAEYVDDGTRMIRSVISCRRIWFHDGQHPTEKPVGILDPLIRYACPPGGTVLDCFAGSGSTAEAARLSGRKAVLIEADERYCELIARRMSQGILGGDVA